MSHGKLAAGHFFVYHFVPWHFVRTPRFLAGTRLRLVSSLQCKDNHLHSIIISQLLTAVTCYLLHNLPVYSYILIIDSFCVFPVLRHSFLIIILFTPCHVKNIDFRIKT